MVLYKADANETEVGTWSAVRDPGATHPWGHRRLRRWPGLRPDGQTSITMTYYPTSSTLHPAPIAYDSFAAVRPAGMEYCSEAPLPKAKGL